MLAHPVETLPHARETLEALAGAYRIMLITKGDLFDQERKLAQSGLGELFDAVEIVSDKTAATYERIFARHGDGPERAHDGRQFAASRTSCRRSRREAGASTCRTS